ncbi:hypothetical protein Tco_0298445 [Tanacetum coccineum]
MQEYWVTVSRHHSSLRFKLNGKSHTVNVDNFRDMLKICPKLPAQKFEEPPLEEDILSFIRDLGHTGEIKFLSDVDVNHMHQPWRSFATIINKCLSGKTTALDSHLMFQVENKNSKKNNDMYYLRFTKVIVDYFMAKDQAIPRRNKMFWHHARDEFMFTTVRVISKHQDTQVYATGEKTPKPKTTKKKVDSKASPKMKTTQATKGKRIKSLAKGDKAAKKKQPAETSMDKGLTVLSDVALTEAEQLKLVIERSKHRPHPHAVVQVQMKGTEDDEDEVNVSEKDDDNDDADNQDDENPENLDEENQDDDDDEQTNFDNDGDDFVHPKFSTHDDEARQEEVNKEDSFDPRVQTPSHDESTDDDNSDEEVQGKILRKKRVMKRRHMKRMTQMSYTNVNVNLEGRDTVMTDATLPNV